MNLKDYPRWDEPDREPRLYRRNRRIRLGRMRGYRAVQVARRMWFVTLTATEIDPEELGRCERSATLTATSREFWIRSRRRARALVEHDQAMGGAGTMYPVEYRHCAVCGRLLLGPEAHEYRLKQLGTVRHWHYEYGPACNLDCKPNGRGPGGAHLTYKRKDKAV